MNLLILESPGKVKKVQSLLQEFGGADWKVVASVGHVRDLPERELGISLPDFAPSYTPTERGKGVLSRLKDLAASASAVYLATDPDREGEAIAWHLADALRLKNPKRITYGEITAAVYDVRTVRLCTDLDGKEAVFEARGRVLHEQGWKVLIATDAATLDEREGEAEGDGQENPVPMLPQGTSVSPASCKLLTKKTKPSARFSEASLVRELENKGIGRPATFAAIVDTILKREYVRVEKRFLMPTPLGEKVVDLLSGAFSFLDYAFTREMEDNLDAIAGGAASYREVMEMAYEQLQQELGGFITRYPGQERRAPEATEFVCDACGKPLVHMKGSRKDGSGEYDFFSCSDRTCNISYANEGGKPGEARKKPEPTKFKCTCGKPLVRRESAKGPFFGCSGYPGCKKLYQIGEDGRPNFDAKKRGKK